MKGVSFITDETRKKRFVQIDLERLEKSQEKIGEFLDLIIAESRKNDPEISWESLKTQLENEGKI